jgi:hypothetical protein
MSSHWSFKMPRRVPPFSMMMDDLGNPPPAKIARCLGVTVPTVRRWIRTDNPPLPVLLAVYWLTSWGQNEAHTEAHNSARLHAGLCESLRRENQTLCRRIEYLERIGHFGSANAPRLERWAC